MFLHPSSLYLRHLIQCHPRPPFSCSGWACKTILAIRTAFMSESHLNLLSNVTDGCRSGRNVGTLAEMFDISCHYGRPEFATIQTDAFNDWSADASTNPFESGLVQLMKDKYNINVEGQYYFIEQDNSLVPVWDFTHSGENAGNPNAIVVAQKVKNAPSPDGPENIDWVELKKTSGNLANQIYRVDTVKGQPPATVSSSLDFVAVLSLSMNFCSAPPGVMQVSSMRRITVRIYDILTPEGCY